MASMKIVCLALFAFYCGSTLATPLLGEKSCTWGPQFWCSNITNAKGCRAVRHCIQSVWEKQTVPEDTDSVCKICTDMVKQARDQLESNQTQEDLKAVFEGSCKLMPVKIVADECVKLVDEFIPELVETLASQMNPQVVCSVAGLCNNERIDKLLANMVVQKPKQSQLCTGCHTVVGQMKSNFDATSYEGFLEGLLRTCGKLGSYSDGCATAVFSHFEDIYTHMQDHFTSDNVCHVAGTCTERFHRHDDSDEMTSVEITPMGNIGKITGDDVPCELCEQLVKHLKDILIANTTEIEFKKVLDGLCKQTGKFTDECLAIADEYYAMIYNFLMTELNANSMCTMVGICPKGRTVTGPIAPLVPVKSAEMAVRVINKPLIGKDEASSYKTAQVNIGDNSHVNVKIMDPALFQLPIERMSVQLPQNKELCTFCQYFLHYLQVEISDASTEETIKNIVEKGCKKLPSSVESQCENFIESYGNAVIALLVQEIDPSQVCPMLSLCPKEAPVVTNVEVLMTSGSGDKPNCPLCLFAVEQLMAMLKSNKTEESIQHALDNLCSHLSTKLKQECSDFVDTYSKQLVEMLVADFTAQEVCVYLKLCKDNKPDVSSLHTDVMIESFHSKKRPMADHNNYKGSLLPNHMLVKDAQISTNEIADDTFNGKTLIYAKVDKSVKTSPQCVICEFVMSQIAKELHDKKTDDEIKQLVHNICGYLPKSVSKECNQFVDTYADLVIDLLTQELAPQEICSTLSFCDHQKIALQNAVMECAVCEEAVDIVERILANPNVDKKIEHLMEKTCYALPARYFQRCVNLMNTYGESIIHLVSTYGNGEKVCRLLEMCGSSAPGLVEIKGKESRAKRQLVGAKKCTWGPAYWCANESQANECGAIKHCQERVWMADKPSNL